MPPAQLGNARQRADEGEAGASPSRRPLGAAAAAGGGRAPPGGSRSTRPACGSGSFHARSLSRAQPAITVPPGREMSSSCAFRPRSAHKHHPPLSAPKSISSPLPQIGPPEKGKPPLVCNHLHPAQTLLRYQLRPGTSSQKKNPHKTAFITADPTTAQHGPREADK